MALLRPGQHAIQNGFHLLVGHGQSYHVPQTSSEQRALPAVVAERLLSATAGFAARRGFGAAVSGSTASAAIGRISWALSLATRLTAVETGCQTNAPSAGGCSSAAALSASISGAIEPALEILRARSSPERGGAVGRDRRVAAVVTIATVSSSSPFGPIQVSAQRRQSRSGRRRAAWMKYGCLSVARGLPLVIAVGRDQAAPPLDRGAKRRLFGHGFGTGIDQQREFARVLDPGRQQPPPHQPEPALPPAPAITTGIGWVGAML